MLGKFVGLVLLAICGSTFFIFIDLFVFFVLSRTLLLARTAIHNSNSWEIVCLEGQVISDSWGRLEGHHDSCNLWGGVVLCCAGLWGRVAHHPRTFFIGFWVSGCYLPPTS